MEKDIVFGMPTLIEKNSARENAELCAHLGLRFVELNMNLPEYQLPELEKTDALQAIAEEMGLFWTIHLDENLNIADFNPLVAEAYRETVRRTILVARELKAPIINMHLHHGIYITLPDRKVMMYERNRKEYLEAFRLFREMCEETVGNNDIRITVENTDGFRDYEKEAVDLLLESPVFGLTWDIGHSRAIGEQDEPFLRAHEEALTHFHIHDGTAEPPRNHLALGDGEIDLNGRLDLARKHGCRCVLETKTVHALEKSVEWPNERGRMKGRPNTKPNGRGGMTDMTEKTYIAIDLKSFYASVECADRGLDPLNANLVVADAARTEKTICLAVSPSLKTYGIPGRARLFEVTEKVREVNAARKMKAPGRQFTGKSVFADELKADPALELDFVIAPPRMAKYMEISTKIFGIYARRVAPEDIHVYSVDEVFIDATGYLKTAGMNAREFAMTLIRDVLHETGITATAGIGTNLYLCKVAMDIEAKHMQADENGVRIAELDEQSYREKLWDHRPLTDFWRVGHGIANRLESAGMRTMGDVARMSEYNEELLYSLFGVNAELLIDHAWGWEPCTIAEIHAYRPETNSVSTGQVLSHPYEVDRGRLIVREMTDLLVLDLVEKCVTTDQMSLTVCYDTENLKDPVRMKNYHGPVELDRYGRKAPKDAHGSVNLKFRTSSTRIIMEAVTELYDRIVAPGMLVRRMYVVANRLEPAGESAMPEPAGEAEQLDLFTDYEALEKERQKEKAELEKERKRQQAVIAIRNRFGKNAILKGMNFEEDATTRKRNAQVGGHKA